MQTATLLDFLADLAQHNDRDWFQAHKPTYDLLRRDFEATVGRWLPELIRLDPTLAGLEARRCIFRIYRDVRFSRNKDPYKTHFSAYFAAGGKAGTGPGYYVQIGPNGQTMLAGGLYQPERDQLARIRQEIDYNGSSLRAVLAAPQFRRFFAEGLQGEKLKKVPAGYSPDHPDLDLLKHKSLVAVYAIPDATARTLDFDAVVPAAFRALQPLCAWLREATEPGE